MSDEWRDAVADMTEMDRAAALSDAITHHTLTTDGYRMAATEGLTDDFS